MSGRLILIQDFWRLMIPSQITLQHISKQVDFYISEPWLPRMKLSFFTYDRGRVAIYGVHGAFVLVLDSILDQLGEIELLPKDDSLQTLPRSSKWEPSWPNLRLREVPLENFMTPSSNIISCLQLTETRLYLSVLSEDYDNGRGENMWYYDFASSP
jgi:hypothetical protein